MPDGSLGRHDDAVNLHAVTAVRSLLMAMLLAGVLGSICSYKKIVAVSRENRPLANLLAAIGFGAFTLLFDWTVLSDPDFYHGDNGPLWCAVGGTSFAAVWLFYAVHKLRHPATAD